MIASALSLDRKALKALRVTDPYSLHRVVYSLYDDVRDEAQKNMSQSSGILFADQGGDFHARRILLLADRRPKDNVAGQYGQVESKMVPENFLHYSRYRFKVIVNPTRRDSASRKLIPIRGRETIDQWFRQRSIESWGFSVHPESLQVDRVEVLRFNSKKKHQVTICQAHLQGVCSVTDTTQFHKSFTKGIGRGRSFGCGLLQLVPLSDTYCSDKE